MIRCETEYPLNIVKNGCSYFYSPALQLAKNLIGERSHCKIVCEERWLGAFVFAREFVQKASWFSSERLGDKIKIAALEYDIDSDRITYHDLTNEKLKSDFLKLDFAIVKGLRESDCVSVKTIERDVRHKAWITYKISKKHLQESEYQVESGIYGDVLIVSKNVFKRVVGSLDKAKKGKK